MGTEYVHTQSLTGPSDKLWTAAWALFLFGLVFFMARDETQTMLIAALVAATPVIFLLLVLGSLDDEMTVRVAGGQLAVSYKFGYNKKTIGIDEILRVEAVRIPWSLVSQQLLPWSTTCTVKEREGLKISMRDGTVYHIGTDNPARLREAIEKAMQPCD